MYVCINDISTVMADPLKTGIGEIGQIQQSTREELKNNLLEQQKKVNKTLDILITEQTKKNEGKNEIYYEATYKVWIFKKIEVKKQLEDELKLAKEKFYKNSPQAFENIFYGELKRRYDLVDKIFGEEELVILKLIGERKHIKQRLGELEKKEVQKKKDVDKAEK